jgi:hypothetical protein
MVDGAAMVTWWAMGFSVVLGLAAAAMRPVHPVYYPSDTGLCDAGCGELR